MYIRPEDYWKDLGIEFRRITSDPATDRKYPLWQSIVLAAPVCLLFWWFIYSVGCEIAHQAHIQ
jgi:hypothetical protein